MPINRVKFYPQAKFLHTEVFLRTPFKRYRYVMVIFL